MPGNPSVLGMLLVGVMVGFVIGLLFGFQIGRKN